MGLISGVGYRCYTCDQQDHDLVARVASEPAAFELWWLCSACLFDAVRDGKLLISGPTSDGQRFGPQGFDDTQEDDSWQCYGCETGQQRVGYFKHGKYSIEFLCPSCLLRNVISGTLSVSVPAAAAPIGPTAKANDKGDISIDGITFNW